MNRNAEAAVVSFAAVVAPTRAAAVLAVTTAGALLSACGGGVTDLADEPLGILVDEVVSRGDSSTDRHEVIGTFGHAGCAKLHTGTAVALNGVDGALLEPGGSADDGTQNCLQPIVKAPFTVPADADADDGAVDGTLLIEDVYGRVEVVIEDLVAPRGFTVDLPATASGELVLDFATQAPRTASARLETGGADTIALGPFTAPGEPQQLAPLTLSLADVPPGTYELVVDATWTAVVTTCEGVKSCDVETQFQERAPLVVE